MNKYLFDISSHTTKNDYGKYSEDFQTPPIIAEYMASFIPDDARTVLEPTPGQGNLVAALGDWFDVTAPDDFFQLPKQRFDAVIMNPPFSAKYAKMDHAPNINGMKLGYFILHECMKMSDVVIALMPWFILLDSDIRLRNLKKFGMKSITPLPRKTFKYARIQTVVLELNKGFTGETAFKYVKFF